MRTSIISRHMGSDSAANTVRMLLCVHRILVLCHGFSPARRALLGLGRILGINIRASAAVAANYPVVVVVPVPVRAGGDICRSNYVRSQLPAEAPPAAGTTGIGEQIVVYGVVVRAIRRVPTDVYRRTVQGIARIGWPVWRSSDGRGRVRGVGI